MTYFELFSKRINDCCTLGLSFDIILGMSIQTEFLSERLDDIPLLIGLMKDLEVDKILDRNLITNGNHKGLSRGSLALVWLAFIISQGDHRKSTVQSWVAQHKTTLEHLLKIQISDTDFNDDRLGLLVSAFNNDDAWAHVEEDWWKVSVKVIPPNNGILAVRVDATTVSGYHTLKEEGMMQLGNSKAHRPDMGQIKIMSSSHQPSNRVIASDIHPGNSADDPLYIPIIDRTKGILGFDGILFLGDCKMAALETRAHIASRQDLYMTPLPSTGGTKKLLDIMITYVLQHPGKVDTLAINGEEGLGFEHLRPMKKTIGNKLIEWDERLFLVQFPELLQRQIRDLEKRMEKAQSLLEALSPEPGKGIRAFRSEDELRLAIENVLEKQAVKGLMEVKINCRETRTTKFVGRGRGAANRKTYEVVDTRYFVGTIEILTADVEKFRQRLGWRLFATNAPAQKLSMTRAIVEYRKGWGLERNFHILKDQPLGISPLFVHKDDQIVGLTRLLLLGNRIMSEIELRARTALKNSEEKTLEGLYAGLPHKETSSPTAVKLLLKVVEAKISLVTMKTEATITHHLTKLSGFVEKIMGFLGLNIDLYTSLIEIEDT